MTPGTPESGVWSGVGASECGGSLCRRWHSSFCSPPPPTKKTGMAGFLGCGDRDNFFFFSCVSHLRDDKKQLSAPGGTGLVSFTFSSCP